MKYIGLLGLGMSLISHSLCAQESISENAVAAMKKELDRNMEQLALPQMPTPFFMAYSLAGVEQFNIQATLGILNSTFMSPNEMIGAVQLFVGDEKCTSDIDFNGAGARIRMPADMDEHVIQRNFWLMSDMMYKGALQTLGEKLSYLRINPLPEKERDLPDFTKVENVRYVQKNDDRPFVKYDQAQELVRKLSEVFIDYKELFNSSVNMSGVSTNIAKLTSENVALQHTQGLINLYVEATVVSNDGIHIPDSYTVVARNFDELPSFEALKKDIKKFAENLLALKDAEPVPEFYSGPVLFEASATNVIFLSNFVKANGLISQRSPLGKNMGNTLDKRMGRKVVDNRISIYNYTNKSKYNNQTLWGCYEMDAEGVAPAKEMTLIENGILKQTLVSTVPTVAAKTSTGSSRFIIHPNDVSYVTAPGTIHIKVDKGIKQEQMIRQLIKAAKEEGLDYAYRIERLAGRASTIFRVDVKTGKETRVRFADLAGVDLAKLKRLGAISREEKISNFRFGAGVLCSLICPKSIIMEDVELNVPNLKQDPEFFLTMPKQRTTEQIMTGSL